MSRVKRLLLLLCLVAATPAFAEGDPKAPPAPAKVVRKAVKKPAPVIPAAPIPYATYAGLSPDMVKALTPDTAPPAQAATPVAPAQVTQATPDVAATPDMLPQPVETTAPAAAAAPPPPPPPPPPEMMADAPPPATPGEISLRCQTRVTEGDRLVSSGTFYIDLFPSPVFPDTHATFKFLFADPGHPSLIRDTVCQDAPCSADVTGQAYYLVNTRTRKGKALRITLDRLQGAFYGEKVDGKRHLGEQGYCTPQALPGVRF